MDDVMDKPKTHDYSRQYWGHATEVVSVQDGGKKISLCGFGWGVSAGDYLILPNGETTTRYQIEEIHYYRDPSDMWQAKATFAPRTEQTNG